MIMFCTENIESIWCICVIHTVYISDIQKFCLLRYAISSIHLHKRWNIRSWQNREKGLRAGCRRGGNWIDFGLNGPKSEKMGPKGGKRVSGGGDRGLICSDPQCDGMGVNWKAHGSFSFSEFPTFFRTTRSDAISSHRVSCGYRRSSEGQVIDLEKLLTT